MAFKKKNANKKKPYQREEEAQAAAAQPQGKRRVSSRKKKQVVVMDDLREEPKPEVEDEQEVEALDDSEGFVTDDSEDDKADLSALTSAEDPDLEFDGEFDFEGLGQQSYAPTRKKTSAEWDFLSVVDKDKREKLEKEQKTEKVGKKRKRSEVEEEDEEDEEDDYEYDDDDEVDSELYAEEMADVEGMEMEDDDEGEEDEMDDDDDDDDDDEDGLEGEEIEEDEGEEEEGEMDQVEDIRVSSKEIREMKEDKPEDYDKEFFAEAPDVDTSVTFADLNLSRPLRKAVDELSYVHPTKVQAKCIPILMEGRDICASAVTGSGKTAAFLLPIMERLLYRNRQPASRVLILLPTRELAVQCFSMAEKLGQFTDIRSCLICGGLPRHTQEQALITRPDIIIATPGRVIDHLLNSKSFTLSDIEILVLDEADRLLQLGFFEQLKEIVRNCPYNRQTMLFSATLTDKVDELVELSLKHPVRIAVDNREDVATGLVQDVIRIRDRNEDDREAILVALCSRTFKKSAMVFCNFRNTVDRLEVLLQMNGLNAIGLHGEMSQEARLMALEGFKKGKYDFLIATDVASRGLDVKGVRTVINFEMPEHLPDYIHRVGRTARAGASGTAVSLSGEASRMLLKKIVKNAHKKGQPIRYRVVPRDVIERYKKALEEGEGAVQEMLQLRKLEREQEHLDMLKRKAENIRKFKAEIMTRPSHQWYRDPKEVQLEKEKDKRDRKLKRISEEISKKKERKRKAIPEDETEEQRLERLKGEYMEKVKKQRKDRRRKDREAQRKAEEEEMFEATGSTDYKEYMRRIKLEARKNPELITQKKIKKKQQRKAEKAKAKVKAKAAKAKAAEAPRKTSSKPKKGAFAVDKTAMKRKAPSQGGRPAKKRRTN